MLRKNESFEVERYEDDGSEMDYENDAVNRSQDNLNQSFMDLEEDGAELRDDDIDEDRDDEEADGGLNW